MFNNIIIYDPCLSARKNNTIKNKQGNTKPITSNTNIIYL